MAITPVSTEAGEEEDQEGATTPGVQTTTIATISIIRVRGRGQDTLHLFTPRISTKRRVNLHSRIMILHMAEISTLSAETECLRHSTQKCGKCFLSEFL